MANDLYDLLNIDKNASFDEIKKSYQNLILKHHTDKSVQINSTPNNIKFSTDSTDQQFIEINKAWHILRDPIQRKIYDAQLFQQQLNDMPIVYEKLNTDDFAYDKEEECYSYMCRCGGVYFVDKETMTSSSSANRIDCFVSCNECSLVIQLK